MSKKHFTTSLDEDLLKEIRKLAIDKGTTANYLMEEGLEYILNKYQTRERQAEYDSSLKTESDEQADEGKNKESE